MSAGPSPEQGRDGRDPIWTWSVCGMLLLATMLNYMDRQTLAQMAQRIGRELHLSNEQYGTLETGFGLAFAAGGIITGGLPPPPHPPPLFPPPPPPSSAPPLPPP